MMQQLLPTFKQTDMELLDIAMNLPFEQKLSKAIAAIRFYEDAALEADPENGYYLCDSFGKDSCVIRHLCKLAGVKYQCHHNLTTLDPPELIRFGRKHHPETIIHKPDIPLLKRIATQKTMLPTRLKRWCCEEYKEGAGKDRVRVFGIRAAESSRRANRWRLWTPYFKGSQHGWVLNPILFWTDEDLWGYIKREGIPYCSLYDEGFARLGCIGCPMADKRRKVEFERWPKYEAAWKRAVVSMWTRLQGKLTNRGKPYSAAMFESPEHLWKWWMEELPEADEDTCQMGLF